MSQSKLGLPIEYKIMPEFFDAHNVCDDTGDKNRVLEGLLKKQGVNTVLDMTCGTGSQVFYLSERGYEVTGSDFSPALLEIAREKARNAGLDISFVDGDMRSVKLGRFDAVITMFNAIGHLTRAGFEKTIRNVGANLRAGGVYAFDIFNLEALRISGVDGLEMKVEKTVGVHKLNSIQISRLDSKKGRLTSFDEYTIQSGTGAPKKLKHKFTLQIYTADQIALMLTRNGFELIGHWGMDGSAFDPVSSPNILTLAKKAGLKRLSGAGNRDGTTLS